MINSILLYIGSGSVIAWGTAHLFPVNGVVREFGDISRDNKLILRMEWITEGFALIYTGILVLLVTLFGNPDGITASIVYFTSAGFLIAMAILSLFTGFKVNFLPYKLCPFIFTASAILILLGCLI